MKKTAPLAAIIGLSAAAALAGILAPAATAATPVAQSVSSPAASSPPHSGFVEGGPLQSKVINTLPCPVVLYPSRGGQIRLTTGEQSRVLEDHAVKIYLADVTDAPLVASIGFFQNKTHTAGSFLIHASNLDGSTFGQWTRWRDKQDGVADTTGFPSGRVFETSNGSAVKKYDGRIVLGGLADLPSGGSDLTVVNKSAKAAQLDGQVLSANEARTVALPLNRPDLSHTLAIFNRDMSSNTLNIDMTQGQPRWETNLSVTHKGSGQKLLNVDVRDQLNKVLGSGAASDQIRYTMSRGWDSKGKAQFTLTINDK